MVYRFSPAACSGDMYAGVPRRFRSTFVRRQRNGWSGGRAHDRLGDAVAGMRARPSVKSTLSGI